MWFNNCHSVAQLLKESWQYWELGWFLGQEDLLEKGWLSHAQCSGMEEFWPETYYWKAPPVKQIIADPAKVWETEFDPQAWKESPVEIE